MSASSTDVMPLHNPKRRLVDATIVQHASKNGLANILMSLHQAGFLKSSIDASATSSMRSLRRQIQDVNEQHSKAQTPYGPVIQTMDLGIDGFHAWEFVSPFALLWHLCNISVAFKGLMTACCQKSNNVLRIVTYIDGVCPGNPLRPEASRNMECIYWVFTDWPQWLLQRANGWFCFGVIRSTVVHKIDGGVSWLMSRVLEHFFLREPFSFTSGIVLPLFRGDTMVRASYCGLLADEKAQKMTCDVKGSSGVKPCLTCKNVTRNRPNALNDYIVDIKCAQYDAFDFHTNESVYGMVERLRHQRPTMGPKAFEQLEIAFGLNYNERSLFFNDALRPILRPVDNMLRDPMHMIVNNGFANIEIARMCVELKEVGIEADLVTEYAMQFTLPRRLGKVQKVWFSEHRNSSDSNSSFASEILTMVPILCCFLVDMVLPRGILIANIRCFELLDRILSLLNLGPDGGMPFLEVLKSMIESHHDLFAQLYAEYVKPKLHHAQHMYDNATWVRKLLSCFVCERKNRSAKRSAVYVYRFLEHTVIADLVNRHCEVMSSDTSVYLREFLINPTEIKLPGLTVQHSTHACLPCGEVWADDLVAVREGYVGKVVRFWQADNREFTAQIEAYTMVGASRKVWNSNAPTTRCVESVDILDTLLWRRLPNNDVRVVPPFLFAGVDA